MRWPTRPTPNTQGARRCEQARLQIKTHRRNSQSLALCGTASVGFGCAPQRAPWLKRSIRGAISAIVRPAAEFTFSPSAMAEHDAKQKNARF